MNKLLWCCVLSLVLNIKLIYNLNAKDDFKIWGPGLKPHIISMPARYFFIQSTREDIRCSEIKLDVVVEGKSNTKHNCRIWTNVLIATDCLHIVRFKLYETCEHLSISVKHGNDHVGESPYIIKEKVYEDACKCPAKDVNTWLLNWECGSIPEQINRDLSAFHDIDFNELRLNIVKQYDDPGAISICHYIIKNNNIHRKCYGKYVGFKMFMDSILLWLNRKMILPDMEFFVNLGDWPLTKESTKHFPMFSWCGSTDSYDIVLPTYDLTESTLENMGRVMLDMLSVQGNIKKSWNDKIPKLFWRGRDSSRERLDLIDISREHPDLFNVSLTNFFFFHSEEDKYGPKTEHVSFYHFFDYKYQLNLDGTVAAYRLPYLLAGDSVLFKQDSKYYEHFYNEMIENVHYVPIKSNLSDLVEKINWAITNDDEANSITKSAQAFARNYLLPKNIFCYHAHVFNEYSKKVISKINVLEDMELVTNTKEYKCSCSNQNQKEEL